MAKAVNPAVQQIFVPPNPGGGGGGGGGVLGYFHTYVGSDILWAQIF